MYCMSFRKQQNLSLLAVVAIATSLVGPVAVQAAELIMFERDGCAWCQRWHREVGAIYDKTAEARVLPLRRVNTDSQPSGGIILASPVRYTPTFVVVDKGREIGRITGYINDDAFWGLLSVLVTRITSPLSTPERS
jgi:thioredoxin-related protein